MSLVTSHSAQRTKLSFQLVSHSVSIAHAAGAWDDVQNSGFRRPGTEVIQASAESVPFAGFAPVSGERTASRRNVFMGSPGTSHDLFDRYHVDRTARPLKRAVFQPEPIFRLDLADDNEDLPCMQQAHSKAGCYRVGLPPHL